MTECNTVGVDLGFQKWAWCMRQLACIARGQNLLLPDPNVICCMGKAGCHTHADPTGPNLKPIPGNI